MKTPREEYTERLRMRDRERAERDAEKSRIEGIRSRAESEAESITPTPAILQGRKASCGLNCPVVTSALELPFFRYRPLRKTDDYYCGCKGWD